MLTRSLPTRTSWSPRWLQTPDKKTGDGPISSRPDACLYNGRKSPRWARSSSQKECSMARPRKTLEEFFWSRVIKTDGCWLWTGRIAHWGYGDIQLHAGARHLLAHRASWIIHHGSIPNKMFVCHTCDNPPCVRPDHLFLGSHTDNMRDAAAKGRMKHGGILSRARMLIVTHCANGHPWDEKNTYLHKGIHRICRECRNLAMRRNRSQAAKGYEVCLS
jgi:hypothetical protein